jgi:hypothetical protein
LHPAAGHKFSGKKSRHLGGIIREVVEILLCPNKMNMEDDFSLNKLLIHALKELKQDLIKDLA